MIVKRCSFRRSFSLREGLLAPCRYGFLWPTAFCFLATAPAPVEYVDKVVEKIVEDIKYVEVEVIE
jgi:hypothetical protein